ncbi:hypothetical protein M433DRAFT_208067 [Acidomyces richmondensis BFW]|nr:MAG: hypothetical protein FE78DRAFT_338864 [Acidomyces sp. 'richmondensis']KYG46312.1 hypothetical protein M433DRAFT_208067 [Acidomyces richmondensis BFW]
MLAAGCHEGRTKMTKTWLFEVLNRHASTNFGRFFSDSKIGSSIRITHNHHLDVSILFLTLAVDTLALQSTDNSPSCSICSQESHRRPDSRADSCTYPSPRARPHLSRRPKARANSDTRTKPIHSRPRPPRTVFRRRSSLPA